MTTATMVYDYARGSWSCLAVRLVENALPTCDYITKILNDEGRYLFPKMIDAPIDGFDLDDGRYSVTFPDDFEFPEVVTLEQSIENNRKLLSSYK